jgi:hypothetical protein
MFNQIRRNHYITLGIFKIAIGDSMSDFEKMKLQNITIALPEVYIDNLEKLIEIGIISSRSEGIRIAIQEFLQKELKNAELLGFKLDKGIENQN